MKLLRLFILAIAVLLTAMPMDAKKYKWVYGDHPLEVYTTGQGKNRMQLIKAWAVAKNADKAIEQAMMDAVTAAFFSTIGYDESTHGMGVSNLQPLVSGDQYREHEGLFKDFFVSGEFLGYVRPVNSAYPSGENNMKVSGGRRVGVNLVLDRPGLEKWLQNKGVKKGLDGHFRN
ncbi:MAG: hypothetical protein K2H35_01975 [Muribaculaceae bacterium]|nr:hypothetical protein [Muribaculaceae bacterium]MDE6558974.1 hypothetical protein [Muribaculaceae bacterium]